MSYKISYSEKMRDYCGYCGYEFKEPYIADRFHYEIKDKLFDISGTEELVKEFKDIPSTGFEKDALLEIFRIEGDLEIKPWRIGEAFAEFFLENEFGARFHYDHIRDAKNINSYQQGADLVGFIDAGKDTVFLFGEVKTSEDPNSPPSVLYGRTGLTNQLENLKNNERLKNNLIRYIGFKVKYLPPEDIFRKDYDRSLKTYRINNKKVYLFGVLIRDTSPNEMDLKSRYESVINDLVESTSLKFVALYFPIKMNKWIALITNEHVGLGGMSSGT